MKNKVFGIFAVILALSLAGCEQPTNTPIVTLSGITAVYNGTATIYPATPLDDLKAGLTVTANYSDSTTQTVAAADYALSGTLTVPSSTVTVTYQGKTDTFAVTVTDPSGGITYSVTQDGGTDNVADSTGMVFTFSASVDSLSLSAADFTVGGAAAKGAELSGTGATRTLAITVSAAGIATVTINKSGIEAETKHLTVYKTGEYAPTLSSITAVYNGTAAVYPATPLNDLKAGLTVKALYSNSSEYTLSAGEYSLSGTLTVPSSTVTVTYQGKTTTFAVTVTAGGNQLPTAHAGNVATQTLAEDLTVTLNGTGSTGKNLTYQWECESYTANKGAVTAEYTKAQVNALITNATAATATVAPRKAGTYVFKLTVTDDEDESDTANVTVVVEPAGTVTTTVSVNGVSQTGGDTVLNFTPVYTSSNTADFPVEDIGNYITYKVTAENDTYSKTFELGVDGFNGKISYDSAYDLKWTTFIQTFYLSNGESLNKSRSLTVMGSTGQFAAFNESSPSANGNIPSISGISLSRTITEILDTITHAITVPAIATIANPLNFGAVSALSGWNSDFPSADVTYILTLDNVAQPAGTTSISANGLSDGQHTITQTFYYKGTAIPNGSRSAVGFVMGNNFAAMVTEGGFPELTLLLRKNAGVVTKTVSTTLDINPISFSIGTELNFTPTYSNVSNPSNFTTNDINNCLTYTITVVNYDGSYTNTWNSANGFDGKIPISDNYEGEFEFNNFTQTFYHNGQQVGSPRVLKVIAENSKFEYFGDDYGGTATIPAINGVSISRTVTE